MNFHGNVYENLTSGRVMCTTKGVLNIIPKFSHSLYLQNLFHCIFFFLTFCLNLQCVHIRSWDKTETNLVLSISRSCPGQYILWHANTLEKLTVLAAVSESVVEKKTNNIKVVLRSLNKQANFQFVIAL